MSHLYVCHFSNGHIKVGRSVDPSGRIAAHADRVACVGITLTEHRIFECIGQPGRAEAILIHACIEKAEKRNKNEWFEGLAFADVCEWASAAALQPPIEDKKGPVAAVTEDLPNRYVVQWVDLTPDVPHWPNSIMRWDLRPDDWHRIWPDLLTHPCALLFAPKHPDRLGPPDFSAWVDSWPVGFDGRDLMKTMPSDKQAFVLSRHPEYADEDHAQAKKPTPALQEG